VCVPGTIGWELLSQAPHAASRPQPVAFSDPLTPLATHTQATNTHTKDATALNHLKSTHPCLVVPRRWLVREPLLSSSGRCLGARSARIRRRARHEPPEVFRHTRSQAPAHTLWSIVTSSNAFLHLVVRGGPGGHLGLASVRPHSSQCRVPFRSVRGGSHGGTGDSGDTGNEQQCTSIDTSRLSFVIAFARATAAAAASCRSCAAEFHAGCHCQWHSRGNRFDCVSIFIFLLRLHTGASPVAAP
jgi:hypothetical protein